MHNIHKRKNILFGKNQWIIFNYILEGKEHLLYLNLATNGNSRIISSCRYYRNWQGFARDAKNLFSDACIGLNYQKNSIYPLFMDN